LRHSNNPWHIIENAVVDDVFETVIEIPRGCRVKYELDKETGLLRVDRVLHSSDFYPYNYGFIPKTLSDDGDPLDVLVIGSESFVPLSVVRARMIGVMRMIDQGKQDDKIIAVHADDPEYQIHRNHWDLSGHVLRKIEHFFMTYKNLEGKEVQINPIQELSVARSIVEEAFELYKTTFDGEENDDIR
jgi:inorganic pyrophosphatase